MHRRNRKCFRSEFRAYQLPGELGLSLHAERICLFFNRLLITSKSRNRSNKITMDAHELTYPHSNLIRIISKSTNTFINAIAVTGGELCAIAIIVGSRKINKYFIRSCNCQGHTC